MKLHNRVNYIEIHFPRAGFDKKNQDEISAEDILVGW